MKRSIACTLAVVALAVGCSGDEAAPFVVTWKFSAGNCTTNDVSMVRVTVTADGAQKKQAEVACVEGRADLGVFPAGTYGIRAEGLDPSSRVVAQNFGNSTTFSEGGPFGDIEVTLNPKAAKVVVNWSMSNGSKCPPNVTLPYYTAIYRPPPAGTVTLTDKVKEVQESCSSGTATLDSIVPGDYVVEVDSRAITPKVRGTRPVTVKPGQDAQVSIQF